MTAVSEPASKRANEIKADLRSVATTTSQTLALLRAILGLEAEDRRDGQSDDVVVKKARKGSGRVIGRPQKTTRKPAVKFEIHERASPISPILDPKDRRRLATETFNSTLKTLSNAAKVQIEGNKDLKDNRPMKPSARIVPLRECSPNRKSKVESSKRLPHAVDDLAPTVECAIVALNCLRLLKVQEDDQRGPDLSLENGALILLDKTITLQFLQLAEIQLTDINDQYWNRSKIESAESEASDGFRGIVSSTLRARFKNDKSEFKFATSLQSQALRFAILKGVDVIDVELLEAVNPDAVGSPAWMILQGLKFGYLDAAAAGLQLRTVSLALSKLYSLCVDNSKRGSSEFAHFLRLATTALRIKSSSWKQLGHQPDLQKEVWSHFTRSVQRYLIAIASSDIGRGLANECLKELQSTLQALGYNDTLPPEFQKAFQKWCPSENVERMNTNLGNEIAPAESSDNYQQLLLTCKIAADHFDSYPNELEQTLEWSNKVLTCIESQRTGNGAMINEILLSGVRLRKSSMLLVGKIEHLISKGEASNVHLLLGTVCLKIVYAFLKYLSRIATASLSSSLQASNESTTKKRQESIMLAVAKTIEAVIAVEKFSMARTVSLVDETINAFRRCLQIGELFREDGKHCHKQSEVVTFLKGMPVRISHVFWTWFIKSVEQRLPLQQSVKILEESISAIEHRSRCEQRSAFLGLKYERLAACYIDLRVYPGAQSKLRAALAFAIEQGVLSDATELALSQASDDIWDGSESRVCAFGKNLASYARLCLGHNLTSSATYWYFDDLTASPIQRCIMLERQVGIALDIYTTNHDKELLITSVKSILELSSIPRYRCYQLRFVSRILRMIAKKQILNAKDFFTDNLIHNLTADEMSDSANALLPNLFASLAATVSCQWALSTGKMDEALLLNSVDTFSHLLSQNGNDPLSAENFCDLDVLMLQLRTLADFAGVLGNCNAQLDALRCLNLVQRQIPNATVAEQILCLTQIGVIRTQCQDTTNAGIAFAQCEKLLSDNEEHSSSRLMWAVGHAEYLFSLSHIQPAVRTLQSARDFFENAAEYHDTSSSRARLQRETTLCRVYNLASRIALHQGSLVEATSFARRAVKLSTTLWLAIEKAMYITTASTGNNEESSLRNITEELSNLTILSDVSQSTPSIQGAKYWPQISLHRTALRHMAAISAHHGLYQDAVYYCQQAHKIASETGCSVLSDTIHSELALLYANAGQLDSARGILSSLEMRLPSAPLSIETCDTILNLGQAYLLASDIKKALECRKLALSAFPSKSQKESHPKNAIMRRPPSKQKNAMPPTRQKPTKIFVQAKASQSCHDTCVGAVIELSDHHSSLKQDAVRQRILIFEDEIKISHHDSDIALDIPKIGYDCVSKTTPNSVVWKALVNLVQAFKIFSSDPVNSVLAETAMAFPVRYRSTRKSGRVSFVQAQSPQLGHKAGKDSAKLLPSTPENSSPPAADEGQKALAIALSLLRTLEKKQLPQLSTGAVDLMHKALSQVALLSTASSQPLSYSSLDVVLQTLTPKDVAQSREQLSIEAECESIEKHQTPLWPFAEIDLHECADYGLSSSDFKSFMDVLPSSWSIVSLGLNYDKTELLLSKVTATRSPFLLRIPLARPGMEEDDISELTFKAAKTELVDIIEQANLSAHDERGQGDKAARRLWYAEREALDNRLEILLANIENVWLGGFRGVLSSQLIDDSLLSRFGKSLDQTLDKHLPSRQRPGKIPQDKVVLHAHVLELFTTITFDDCTEFEDSVTDLLYFVVDILQFNGEPNAYDEIDFDAILVEVIDALRGYHAAHTSAVEPQARHTILIPDKEIQAFPWESLPCLRSRSVSRMPSLLAVKQRLDMIRTQSNDPHCYTIPANSGAYILNPSSDLTSTQEAFSATFNSQLPTFTSLTKRAPTETEFASYLQTHPLLLYFGHGSGAQYIRGRTIRKMDHCAVTLLMGCSSARMTECGVYQPHGMPNHYMHAGAPAVVGTLWDVTDRDIDRFAMRMMCEWGLLEEDEAVQRVLMKTNAKAKTGVKGKGKKPAVEKQENAKGMQTKRGVVALDEAVSKARDSCLLRYLNGAAPVIYGVPILLE